jgi:hypothetical protein
MSFVIKDPPMPPKLNERRAQLVLAKIDQILAWEQQSERERDGYFVELGRYLCEVRAGQYWRIECLSSFDDFLKRRFPASRRKAYYLMSIHENLPKQLRQELKQIGWSKAVELAKLARRQGQGFKSATWLHMARELPKDRFAEEIDRVLNGPDAEPSDLIYFRVYKSQVPVIEQALEVAARMLGSDRSRAYCLEMICADFLAGANLQDGDQNLLLLSVSRFFHAMPHMMQQQFLASTVRPNEDATRAA